MTREEYEKTYVRMMDSVRTDEFYQGHKNCEGVPCEECPIVNICQKASLGFSAFAIMETVKKWGKEHPIITNADKFKEVFGFDPIGNVYTADEVEFWKSEYVEPKKGEEDG